MFEGNPFPGLRPFEFDENYLFFGREEQVTQLLQRLGNTRFLAVVGASGSGKSSLVRAGLLPELHGGTMTSTSIAWELAIMRPGGDPLSNLAEALVASDLFGEENEENILQTRATLTRSGLGLIEAYRHSEIEEGTNLLLLVDQFEEIFRFRQNGEKASQEASHFIQLLLETARQSEVPVFIILTMRSDFLGDCAEFQGLAEAVNEGEYLIPRLNRKQRARAIEGPVKVGGADISPRLKQQLLNDIGDDPDQLPILQHALMRMWDHWQAQSGSGKELDLEHYDAIGRMTEALSRHADEVFHDLPDDQHRLICMKLFKAITEKQSNGRGIRRPLPLGDINEITGDFGEDLSRVINAFRPTGRTFIMPGEKVKLHDNVIIDISHESLMRVWKRLRTWVSEEAESARIYSRLCETAELHHRGEAGYYRDPDLKIALAWRSHNKPNANWGSRINDSFDRAMQFLDDSKKDFEAELKAKEAARKRELDQAKALAEAEKQKARMQAISAKRSRVFAIFLFVMIILVGFLAFQAHQSEQVASQYLVDSKFETVDQYLDKDRPDLALELLVNTYRNTKDDPRIITKLGAILTSHHFPKHIGIMQDAEMELDLNLSSMRGLISQNKRYASCISNSGLTSRLKILDLKSQNGVILDKNYDRLFFSAFSNDEKFIAVGGKSGGKFNIEIYSLNDGLIVSSILTESPSDCGVFSFDNNRFYHGDRKGNLRCIWLESSKQEIVLHIDGHQFTNIYQNSKKNQLYALSQKDGLGKIHEISDNQHAVSILLPDTDVFDPVGTFSGNGEFFALGIGSFSAGQVMVYNQSLKNLIWENSSIHKRNIIGMDISSNNSSLVTASLDKTAYIWDLKTGALKSPVMQHDVFAWWAKFSPDDSKVVTTTDNNGISIWDAKTGKILTPPFYSRDTILGVEFDEKGKKIMCGLLNGEFHEWDIHSGRPLKTFLSHDAPITGTAISAQQDFILTGDETGKIKIWSKSNSYFAPKVINTTNRIGKVAILDQGKKVAAIYENGENSWRGFTIWDTASHEKLVEYSFSESEPERNITAVALSSNGKRVAYAVLDEDIINLIETDKLEVSKTIGRHNNIIRDLYFSPDSKYLASISQDGTSLMFSADKNFGNPITLAYKFGFGGRLTFSKDSSKLAASSIVGSDKNLVKIWETKTGQPIKILPHDYAVRSITFSDYKNAVYTGSSDSYVRLWNLDNQSEEPEFELKHENRVEVIEEYPERIRESFVLTVTDSGTVRIWDTEARKVIVGPIQNRSEVPPWQRTITFLRNGEAFLYNHSREILHMNHFPHGFLTQLSPKETLALSDFFIAKQRGLEPASFDLSDDTINAFMSWYSETEKLSSFFIGGEKISDLADAYSKQNTKISNHNLKLIGDTTSSQ